MSAAGAPTCTGITNAFLTTGTFTSITGVGTLTAGATGAGFTVALGTSTITGQLVLANGGTNASLTASNGGMVWSNASQLQILAGSATANLPLVSGATASPAWAAYAIPSSITTGQLLYASSSSAVSGLSDVATGALLASGGTSVAPAYCTACTLSTSLTTPIHYGGSAAGSSLTLASYF